MIYTRHICGCSDRELADFEWLASFGQCTPRVQLERIRFIGFAYEGSELIATRALKKPFRTYKESVFARAGLSHLANAFYYESGYSYTVSRFRRMSLSKMLLEMLLRRAPHSVYATTRYGNMAAVRTMMSVGGSLMGRPYMTENDIILLWSL